MSAINVKEAADGETIKKGWVYIAPGGKHIRVRKKGMDYVISLSDEAPLDGLKPCANIMYESLTQSNYDENNMCSTYRYGCRWYEWNKSTQQKS